MVPRNVKQKCDLSCLRIQKLIAVAPVIITKLIVNNRGGYGVQSCVVGALGGKPAWKHGSSGNGEHLS